MKFGIYVVLRLVKDFLEENISPESFDKNLQILIDSNSVKFNTVWNRMCLCIPKNNTCKEVLIIKEELQFFKSKLIKELKCLAQTFSAEKNSLKSDELTLDAPITNTPLIHSDVFITRLLFLSKPTDKLFIKTCTQT